jgi:hypothetical protein
MANRCQRNSNETSPASTTTTVCEPNALQITIDDTRRYNSLPSPPQEVPELVSSLHGEPTQTRPSSVCVNTQEHNCQVRPRKETYNFASITPSDSPFSIATPMWNEDLFRLDLDLLDDTLLDDLETPSIGGGHKNVPSVVTQTHMTNVSF